MSQVSDAIDHARRTWSRSDGATMEELRSAAASGPMVRSLAEMLSSDELTIVVEPKRATMERGTINESLDFAAVAADCEAGGASAISVVTEPMLSGGSIEDLRAARSSSRLPVLARDYIVDVRQVLAYRAAGADALFIPAHVHLGRGAGDASATGERATSDLAQIIEEAHALRMEVVMSVCSDDELELAIDNDVDVLNIDNRDDDGNIDVERTFEMLADVPAGWPVMSESITAMDHLTRLRRAGVDALLLDEGHLGDGLVSALAIYAAHPFER